MVNSLDKSVRDKISASIKPTITLERRKKMSKSMKTFWEGQKAKDREISKLKKRIKELEGQLAKI